MNRIFSTLCVPAVLSALASCDIYVAPEVVSEQPGLKTAKTEIVVPADRIAAGADTSEFAEQAVYDTIAITGNRSWTLTVETEDGSEWAYPSQTEFVNVSGTELSSDLVMQFNRYAGDTDRSGKLIIHGSEIDDPIIVPFVQKAYVPEVTPVVLGDSSSVTALSGSISILVKSNTSWSAQVDESASTVTPVLSIEGGSDVKQVDVTFPDNFNDESGRYARIVFKARDCEDKAVLITQRQSDNYFYMEGDFGGELSPIIESVNIPLRSNGAWTAEISDCTYENASLQPASGDNTITGINFVADHGADPEVAEKHATVTIRREGKEDIVVKFSQRGCIHLIGGRLKATGTASKPYVSVHPFTVPASFPTSYSTKTYADSVLNCTMANGGYVFTIYGQTNGVWYNTGGQLIMIGKSQNDYILFPGLDGYRLSGLYYVPSCIVSVDYTVRTADGSAVIGGGERRVTTTTTAGIDAEYYGLQEHSFTGTVAGGRYRLNLEAEGENISIKDICLVYEKVGE